MNQEHGQLIAKIQYFYDVLCERHDDSINEIFESLSETIDESKTISTQVHSVLAEKYRSIFEEILYTE